MKRGLEHLNCAIMRRTRRDEIFLCFSLLRILKFFFFSGNVTNSAEHEQKRWETSRRRSAEIAFVYQNMQNNKKKWINNIGEHIIVICIWKIDGKGCICLENQAFSTLNLRHGFMPTPTQISHLYWIEFRSIRRCLAFPGQIHRWILNGIIKKKMCSDVA